MGFDERSPTMLGWAATGSGVDALATAAKVAAAGQSHYITAVFAGYSGAATGLLQVKDDVTVIAETYIVNAGSIELPYPIRATAGNAVSAELAAGGAAIIGKVNLAGFTI